MGYVFVADDFTGASDTLATLARAGLRARLFRDLPDPAALHDVDVWGIATHARALDRAGVTALAARLGAGLAPHAPEYVHVKICSTFDSSPEIGNIALLAQGLADALGIADIAVIGGQPSLGRHAVFATLFARGPDGLTHRIDRHPVMARHPVTPMAEADLIRHLSSLGLNGLNHVGRGQQGQGFPRLYDALDQDDVLAAGRDLRAADRALVVMGASSVAEAWIASLTPPPDPTRAASTSPAAGLAAAPARGPVFAFAGSRSVQTTDQIGAAGHLARLPVNPAQMMAGPDGQASALHWAQERLMRGQDCLIYLTGDDAGPIEPADLAQACAGFVQSVLSARHAGGLVVAGGDTSSAIIGALAPEWLDYAADLCPGVPILRARMRGGDLPLALKGGQMGDAQFFALAIAALRAA